jgi:hypothetical protein
MTYLLAVVLSLIVSFYVFASEVTAGNIRHLQNGREPNAGAAVFPTVPLLQMLAVGLAWFLERVTPEFAIWGLVGGFLVLSVRWAVSIAKLKAELIRVTEDARQHRAP